MRRLNRDVRRAQQRRDVLRRAVEDHVRQTVIRGVSTCSGTGIEWVVRHVWADQNEDGPAIDCRPRVQQIHDPLFDTQPADVHAQEGVLRPAGLLSDAQPLARL